MKIGVAVIACDRFDYTEQCVASIYANKGPVDIIMIVNDGQKIPKHHLTNYEKQAEMYERREYDGLQVINNEPPYQTVGKTKNRALKALIAQGCDELFLVENDQIIKTPDVWMNYINASNNTGITHLNFGYHGPANRTPDYSKANPRCIIDYPDGTKIALNPHSVGAFSYFKPKYLTEVGYHDEYFQNAWEHVELCQRGIKKGLLPAFWWFPDVAGSENWITEVAGSIQNSSITHTEKWTTNMKKGADYYRKKHGVSAVENTDTAPEKVSAALKKIYACK